MMKSEIVCFGCGESTLSRVKQISKGNGLTTVATAVFYLSVGLIVISLLKGHDFGGDFLSTYAPPITISLPLSLALWLVKRSMDENTRIAPSPMTA
jgi:hypothetical protein